MNHRFWSGVSATLLVTALGTTSSSNAELVQADNQGSEVQEQAKVAATPTTQLTSAQQTDVLKMGEYQSQTETEKEQPAIAPSAAPEAIAKINTHQLDGKQAVTLYVRSIPVLTFLGASTTPTNNVKMGETAASPQSQNVATSTPSHSQDDPVWRATQVMAALEQMNRDNLDANKIVVSWKPKCKCYTIKVDDRELVDINAKTILPDTTHKLALDALQATNRLRRLLGNAPPLEQIANKPQSQPEENTNPLVSLVTKFKMSGMASWYGPGFDGLKSASGEVYRQNELTAAHRRLPFGTKVRVTNLNNGRSVVVRINDRGPFIRGRIIDLSRAAAKSIGLTSTGVAPVQVDVLSKQ